MASPKQPELRMYTYIGFAFALIGFLLTLVAIAIILGFVYFGVSYFIFIALALGALAVATFSFHRLGKKRIPV